MTRRVIILLGLLLGVTLTWRIWAQVIDAINRAPIPWGPGDFYTLYSAALAVSRGISPYDHAAVARIQQEELGWDAAALGAPSLPYFYPPWYALLALPLALLPFRTAMVAWLLANFLMLMASCLLILRALSWQPGRWLAPLLLLATLFAPTLGNLTVGQYGLPVLLGMTLLLALNAGALDAPTFRWAIAPLQGLALVLFTFKPQLGLPPLAIASLWLARQRRFKPLAWGAAILAALAFASFRVSPHWPWEMMAAQATYAAWAGLPFPIKGCDTCSTTLAALEWVLGQGNPTIVLYCAIVAVLLVFLALAWRRRAGDLVYLLSLVTVITALGTPYLRNYDLVILILPFLYALRSSVQTFNVERSNRFWFSAFILACIYLLPLVFTLMGNRLAVGRWGVVMSLVLLSFHLPGKRGKGEKFFAPSPPEKFFAPSPLPFLLILGLSLLIRAATALLVSQPGYMDAYYYHHVATNLATGRGFVEDFLWNYLDDPAGIPHPSNLYWMPLTSLLMVPTLWLLGPSFRAAQVSLVLISSLLPLIAYATASLFLFSPGQRYLIAALTIFSGTYFIYWVVSDSFTSFGVTGSLALICMAIAMDGNPRWFVAAGAFAGLAYLARPDGLLLVPVLAAMAIIETRRNRISWGWVFGSALAFLIVVSPWLYRNYLISGTLSPAGSETLFLREYNDLFRYGRRLDLTYYLSWGWDHILLSKLQAAWANLLVFAEPFLFYLLPFAFIGFWRLGRSAKAWPFLLYAILLYLTMTLFFTFAGPRGSLFHSQTALLPFYYAATVKGLEAAIHFASQRLRHWVEEKAQRNFLVLVAAVAIVMSGILSARKAATWDERYLLYSRLAAWFAPGAADRAEDGTLIYPTVMVVDPPAWNYVLRHGGFGAGRAIVFANEDLPTHVAICRRYGARYLILEGAHPLPLHRFYLGLEDHPALTLRYQIEGIRIYEVR